ncbi:Phosphate transport system permease protein [Petrocella atlantisensis]|uniref:Phosphate transport system permease protein n=1 Tax=Petrocella atlantisensis TaxID=2173034 RepID=A0A3P7NZZ0_9FIRM|nr:phosphate ABC transporter permease subunit PstC [Petrocella atlantisensis]VDN48724.1 Phosphate transport system permease protein [Petrocella atlantisensis]
MTDTKYTMKLRKSSKVENIVPIILFVIASISVVTSIGIVLTLVVDASRFFAEVSIAEVFGTKLEPLKKDPSFGFLPLITGTIVTSLIAMLVAAPLGITSAIFLSEFMSSKMRRIIKPIIEVLAGIPTIVYGFFAYNTVTPLLMNIFPELGAKNALSPGIVMGIMILPIVTSLSEDAMSSVPDYIRKGAYGLGSTKLEVATKVIVPSAISGIVAAFVLAISRAIGETMIVTIASGSSKQFTLDIMQPMQTMTAYIVEFTSGDAGSGTIGYYSLYAVGLMLFVFTMLTNLLAKYITKKYRREY